jgi:hypothetical protein
VALRPLIDNVVFGIILSVLASIPHAPAINQSHHTAIAAANGRLLAGRRD